MHSRYKRLRIKAASERGTRMAKARWKYHNEQVAADMPERIRELQEIEVENMPRKQGDAIGCFQWTDFRTGQARRWIIRIGDRIDRITAEFPNGKPTQSHGWTWFFETMRKHMA
jgi:hypothetical protein